MNRPVRIPVNQVDENAHLPSRAHANDAGFDLHATHGVNLAPGSRAAVGTGMAVAIPDGYAGFILPRSGLALDHGVTVANAPGLIDAGYRGEIRVILVNADRDAPYTVEPGDRIAQLVVMEVAQTEFLAVERLERSTRGDGGFGSTGRT